MNEQEVRKIVQDEMMKNYFSGSPVVPPHTHNGINNLQIKETDKGTMLFSKSVVKKYEKSSHSRFNKEIDALLSGEVEEVNGALFHPEVGEIDIVWGNEGTEAKQYSDGFGLAKILKKHPEVNPYSLMDIVARARKTKAKGNTIELEDENTRLVLKLDWEGETTTAFSLLMCYLVEAQKVLILMVLEYKK